MIFKLILTVFVISICAFIFLNLVEYFGENHND